MLEYPSVTNKCPWYEDIQTQMYAIEGRRVFMPEGKTDVAVAESGMRGYAGNNRILCSETKSRSGSSLKGSGSQETGGIRKSVVGETINTM